jgi:hypothetical protein
MKHYRDNNGNLYAYELDGSQDHLIGDKTPVDDSQLISIIEEEKLQRINSLPYQEQRRLAYPSIGDQLDALWKGGDAAAAMLEQILSVKSQYPKNN